MAFTIKLSVMPQKDLHQVSLFTVFTETKYG